MIIIHYAPFFVLFLTLFAIAVIDSKSGIIPDRLNLVLLVNGFVYGLVNQYSAVDYLFYMFLVSVPLLFLSCVSDILTGLRKDGRVNRDGLLVLGFFVLSVIPFMFIENLKTAFVAASIIFLAPFLYSMLTAALMRKKNDEETGDDEEYSLGGGDIKLFAVLGLHFGLRTIAIAFYSFLLSLIFVAIFRKKRIYLAPFIFVSSLFVFFINRV